MEQKIFEIIINIMNIKSDRINRETDLFLDLEMNSFDIVNLITEIEDQFNLEIFEKDIKGVKNIDDIIKVLKQKGV